MRLTFCTTDGANAFNGINAWLIRFLPALRARGHDARVLLFPWSRPEHCTTLPLLRNLGVPVEPIFPFRDTESAIRAILRHVRRSSPEVFVANMVVPALFAGRWIRDAGIPTIAMLHNDDAEYRALAQLFAGPDESFRASALVSISRHLVHVAEPLPAGLLARCIPYGVPLPKNRATWDGAEPLRLVYHGRIVQQQKRIIETVAACVRLARATGKVTADFFGSGPDEGLVREALARDDAGGRVRFRGALSPVQVSDELRHHHVAVLLSDYEGLGLSILEAMAAGLVPVCFRTERGLPDLIDDDINGIFVDDREIGFDAAILQLLAEPSRWQRLADQARQTVTRRFSEAAALDAWESLLSELVARAPRHRPPKRPGRIVLPPVHPDLKSEDRRYPGLARAIWRRLRFPFAP